MPQTRYKLAVGIFSVGGTTKLDDPEVNSNITLNGRRATSTNAIYKDTLAASNVFKPKTLKDI